MSEFEAYFSLGFEHIISIYALDHILYIGALAAIYELKAWRKILVLISAFTVGHSITLALASLQIIRVDPQWVELLIPVTIFITALLNLYEPPDTRYGVVFSRRHNLQYLSAILFGCIHGLAYSGVLQSFFAGMQHNIVWLLFAFNVGVEVGQILVVAAFLLIAFILIKGVGLSAYTWNILLSGLALVASVLMLAYKVYQLGGG